jgi:hypothetical protein
VGHTIFSEICNNTFNKLFKNAKETNQTQFLTSFFSFGEIYGQSTLSYISDYEFAEVLELLNNFNPLQTSNEINIKDKVRIQMFLYCHIIEVDLIYHILFNMIQTIKRQSYSSDIFSIRKKKSKNGEKGSKKIAKYPIDKIKVLKVESDKFEMPLDKVFSDFYSNTLRNAFNHSQYFVEQNGTFSISQSLSQFSQGNARGHYSAEAISHFYQKSLTYIKTFINCYKSHIKEFMDGEAHDTNFGKIEYSIPIHNGWGFKKIR